MKPAELDSGGFTEDRLLGGVVRFRQPRTGYRAAIDPVLLAASIPVRRAERVLDMGCGAGAVSLCVAHRCPAATIEGIDIQEDYVALAKANSAENGFSERLSFCHLNILLAEAAPPQQLYDHVAANPPFHAKNGWSPSASPAKDTANAELAGCLGDWVKAAITAVRPKGTVTFILKTERLDELLVHMAGGLGDLHILPLWPKSGRPAKRIIVQGRKNIRSGSTLLPGLVLHEADGGYTAAAGRILKDGDYLALCADRS